MPANRTETGQFVKGQSGNPSGRPKRSEIEKQTLAALCELAPEAVQIMREILHNDGAPPAVRLKCAETIIERVCGKAIDAHLLHSDDGEPDKNAPIYSLLAILDKECDVLPEENAALKGEIT